MGQGHQVASRAPNHYSAEEDSHNATQSGEGNNCTFKYI